MTASIRAEMAHLVEAAIASVRPETLVPHRLAAARGELLLDGQAFPVAARLGGRIVVVGGGKAAAGMAAAVEAVLASARPQGGTVSGLVSVPAGCVTAEIVTPPVLPRAAAIVTSSAVVANASKGTTGMSVLVTVRSF